MEAKERLQCSLQDRVGVRASTVGDAVGHMACVVGRVNLAIATGGKVDVCADFVLALLGREGAGVCLDIVQALESEIRW